MNPATTRRRVLHIAPGIIAAVIAGGLGATVWAVFLSILLYLLAFMPRRRDALVALLAAPILLAVGSPLPSLLQWQALVWIPVLFATLAPLFLVLGGRIPWRPVPAVTLSALALTIIVVLVRWTPTFTTSDVATRAQVLLLGAMTLLVSALTPHVRRTTKQKSGQKKGAKKA